MAIKFRPIEESEVDQLRSLALATFTSSYLHLNTASNFSWYVNRAFKKEQLLSEILNPESFFFFATLNSKIIGYLKLNVGSSQSEPFGDELMEIERIYLVEEHQRKGFGWRVGRSMPPA